MTIAGEKENVIIYNKKHLIREVAEKLNIYPSAIEEVYLTLEEIIMDHLMEAERDTSISVKVFEGCRFDSKIVPEHYHNHPTAQYTLVPERLKFNCKISTPFHTKKREEYAKSKEMLNAYLEERAKYSEQYKKQMLGDTYG